MYLCSPFVPANYIASPGCLYVHNTLQSSLHLSIHWDRLEVVVVAWELKKAHSTHANVGVRVKMQQRFPKLETDQKSL